MSEGLQSVAHKMPSTYRLQPVVVQSSFLTLRGTLYSRQGQLDLAIADANRAVENSDSSPSALRLRGACRLAASDVEAAIADFRMASEIDPSEGNLLALSDACRKIGSNADAHAAIDRLFKLDPQNAAASLARARVHLVERHLDAAIENCSIGLQNLVRQPPRRLRFAQVQVSGEEVGVVTLYAADVSATWQYQLCVQALAYRAYAKLRQGNLRAALASGWRMVTLRREAPSCVN